MKIIKFLIILTFVVYLKHGLTTVQPGTHIVKGESMQISKESRTVTLTSKPEMKGKRMFIPTDNILIIIEEGAWHKNTGLGK